MRTILHATYLLPIAGALALMAACVGERERPLGEGAHPDGWTVLSDEQFHGRVLSLAADPVEDCAKCHGEDLRGGAVGVSCATAGCHTEGVEACGTCHGTFPAEPKPSTGAHAAHAFDCATCHKVPTGLYSEGHRNGVVDFDFSGVAISGGLTPAYDSDSGQCSGTYCHGGASPPWTGALPACGGCHSAPPQSHVRFARVADESTCVNCHPSPSLTTHIDGILEVTVTDCAACHGETPSGAPPLSLDGATAASDAKVGAHQRHLDPSLPGRIGPTVACATCHPVPANVLAPGHLDESAPATVVLPFGGAYDSATGTCEVWCHFERTPGPTWRDDSGAARACDACHGFGPVTTRIGTPHPTVLAPSLELCRVCHPFDSAVHINGTVDFVY